MVVVMMMMMAVVVVMMMMVVMMLMMMVVVVVVVVMMMMVVVVVVVVVMMTMMMVVVVVVVVVAVVVVVVVLLLLLVLLLMMMMIMMVIHRPDRLPGPFASAAGESHRRAGSGRSVHYSRLPHDSHESQVLLGSPNTPDSESSALNTGSSSTHLSRLLSIVSCSAVLVTWLVSMAPF